MAIKTKADEMARHDARRSRSRGQRGYQGGAAQRLFSSSAKGIEQTVAALKDGMAQAAAGFEKTQAQMKEGMEKAMKTAEEFVAFGQGNLEAFMKSGQIWAAGVQDLQQAVRRDRPGLVRGDGVHLQGDDRRKSLKDAFDLQAEPGPHPMEKTIAESGRLTDASFKLTEQTLAPITARVTLAVEKFAKPV